MSKTEAQAKIRKLLAVANRPGTPQEGETALQMARNLAAKHGLVIQLVPKRAAQPAADWLNDYLRRTDRDAAERTAQAHARQRQDARSAWESEQQFQQRIKEDTEAKRRETMSRRAYDTGFAVGMAGGGYMDCHYKRRIVFGVNLKQQWVRGFEAGRARRNQD